MLTYEKIREAQERIAPYIRTTPLLRLPALDAALGCQVYAKAECMQNTGSFKLRGAINKLLSLTPDQRKNGVVAASSGNHGRAVAYGSRLLGCTATIVVPLSTPAFKVNAIKALGAEVVQCETAQRFDVARELCEARHAALIPPYNDELIMAGQGTAGLEIAAQLPELDAAVVPVSGGGLIAGTAAALKSVLPNAAVHGAEPAALPRYTASLAAGGPVSVEQKPTLADALVSQRPGDLCYPEVAKHVTSVADVEDPFILRAMKLLLTEGKLLAEPSSCIGIAAVLQGGLSFRPDQKVCFLLSGGNVGLDQIEKFIGEWKKMD